MKIYTIIAGSEDVGKRVYLETMRTRPNSLGLVFCDMSSKYLIAKNPVECMKKGYNFTVETTLQSDEAASLAKMARDKGYFVVLHFIGIDKKIKDCEKCATQFENQKEILKKLLPLCDDALFIDNAKDFEIMAEYKDNNIVFNTENLPNWLSQIKEKTIVFFE